MCTAAKMNEFNLYENNNQARDIDRSRDSYDPNPVHRTIADRNNHWPFRIGRSSTWRLTKFAAELIFLRVFKSRHSAFWCKHARFKAHETPEPDQLGKSMSIEAEKLAALGTIQLASVPDDVNAILKTIEFMLQK